MGDIMKYAIDRIENNIAVLENIDTRDIIEVDTNKLPNNIKEGMILNYCNEEYTIDLNEEEVRRKRIEEKLDRLKNLNKGDNI